MAQSLTAPLVQSKLASFFSKAPKAEAENAPPQQPPPPPQPLKPSAAPLHSLASCDSPLTQRLEEVATISAAHDNDRSVAVEAEEVAEEGETATASWHDAEEQPDQPEQQERQDAAYDAIGLATSAAAMAVARGIHDGVNAAHPASSDDDSSGGGGSSSISGEGASSSSPAVSFVPAALPAAAHPSSLSPAELPEVGGRRATYDGSSRIEEARASSFASPPPPLPPAASPPGNEGGGGEQQPRQLRSGGMYRGRPVPQSEPPARRRSSVRFAPEVESPKPTREALHKRARQMAIEKYEQEQHEAAAAVKTPDHFSTAEVSGKRQRKTPSRLGR